MQRGRDVDDVAAFPLFERIIKSRLAHVKSTQCINLNDCFEAVRAQFLRRRQKVSSSAIDKDVQLTESLDDLLHNCFARLIFTNISWKRQASALTGYCV